MPGSLELTVHAGQQVELLETCNDWYLVRLVGKDDSSTQEGLVPPSCIKSSMKHSSSKISIENEGIDIIFITCFESLSLFFFFFFINLFQRKYF